MIKENDTKGINHKKYFYSADFLMNPAPSDSIYKFCYTLMLDNVKEGLSWLILVQKRYVPFWKHILS